MKKSGIMAIIIFALNLALFIGSFTIIKACDPAEDGSWMLCHWAERGVTVLAAVMTVTSLVSIFVKSSAVRSGLAISTIPAAIACALMPGTVIRMCMMSDMRCQMILRPTTLACAVLIAVMSVVLIIVSMKEVKCEN